MTRGRLGTRLALVGFGLIVAVTLGGMTWGTLATLRLARVDLAQQHAAKVRKALWQLDSLLTPVIMHEAGRHYTHYVPFYRPLDVWTVDGVPLERGSILLRSPLLNPPSSSWVELYFQVCPDGTWSSPQLPETADLPWVEPGSLQLSEQRQEIVRRRLEELSSTLPLSELRQRVAKARAAEEGLYGDSGPAVIMRALRSDVPPDYQRRTRAQRFAQLNTLPVLECDPAQIVVGNVDRQWTEPQTQEGEATEAASPLAAIEVSPMTSIWLDGCCGPKARLAFVRTVTIDSDEYLQGFVACWAELKPGLLAHISELFPAADLQPVSDRATVDPATIEMMMSSIDAKLAVPPDETATLGAAWRSVRPTLLTSWAAAVLVLAGAGFGVRSLLALTERRLQFAYAVTHELRTPLTTFRLYSDMLSAGLVPEPSRQEYLDTLDRESERLASLVEGILEYARIENQKVRLNPTAVEGEALVRQLLERFRERCAAAGVQLLSESTWPDGWSIRTDAELVQQVVAVLVNNACRYAQRGGGGTVVLCAAGANGRLVLDVIDNGPGIDRADARTIFKPFRRGRRVEAGAAGGIGLGLALARNWARLLGGKLELAARHDAHYGGAHFRLTVPDRTDA
ncbi:MAG TPA: HAMP domain-containing sensor histidine kinase [Phycisphaerae bacterium]|nr:HAMP domain-containing sensor histidine kinase [Phycisphaerae bacterium]HNU44962.1 HAMP domain-containing sensor histidine kinase [Phycisphaerae bacterium]